MGVAKLELNHSVAIFFTLQVFSLIIAADTLLINDYRSGMLERFYLIYRDLTHVLAAKSIAYVLKATLLVIMILPIACLLLEIDVNNMLIIATASFLVNISTTSLLCISTSLLVSMKNAALLSLIVLAFSIPNLIFASLTIQNLVYIKLMLAYLIIFVPIFIYLANQVLKYSFADK
jgi:heme exporter protein CcmB